MAAKEKWLRRKIAGREESLGEKIRWEGTSTGSGKSLGRKIRLTRKITGQENELRAENHWVRKFANVVNIPWGDCVHVFVNY